jgi:uracil-DNA glycosylase family 4
MNREEAVLRELNLYPQWQRRGEAASAAVQTPSSLRPETDLPTPAVIEAKIEAEMEAPVAHSKQDKAVPVNLGELGWSELKERVRDCTACKLRAGCTQTVFGAGDEKASWLFVGEGPGADEDERGEPFVGQAGKLLDNMLMAIKLKRDKDVYIGNVVKCRPPGNRNPEADEIATCLPYLQRQIELIRPKIIVALGKTAANALLEKEATLASLRGRLHDYHGIPLVITYHPAYLLRRLEDKAKAWQDLCLAAKTMEG